MSGSRLGIHAIEPDNAIAWIKELADAGKPLALIKAVDNNGVLVQAKQVSPFTKTIARFTPEPSLQELSDNPNITIERLGQLADVMVGQILARTNAEERVATDYYEICNEPAPPHDAGYRNLALLMIECMTRAEANGLKLGLFALNEGTPEWSQIQAAVETGVFGRAKQGGHIFCVHEGTFEKPIDIGFGDTIPGAPSVPDAGSRCFRYRYFYHLLEQRDEVVSIVVSEWYGGYSKDGLTAEQIVERAGWYDREFARKSYSLAFCPFTIGPGEAWKEQNYEYAYRGLVEHAKTMEENLMADFTQIHAQLDALKKIIPIARVRARVKINLKIRDASGNDTGRVLNTRRADGSDADPIDIYEKDITVGPNAAGGFYAERVIIDPITRENVRGRATDLEYL